MTRRYVLSVALGLWCFLPLHVHALADYVEIRSDATLYEQPSRLSDLVTRLQLADLDKPFAFLLDEQSQHGYYRIRVPGTSDEGWVYKTYIRRRTGLLPYPPYKRELYEHWIDEDGDCRDTRAEVLLRDSVPGSVKFDSDKRCKVKSGKWVDPYTGETFTQPSKLQIDHVVALKNAHDSGGWAWSADRKRGYANFLGSDTHLLAVKGIENQRKGAKGPDKYLPPRAAYHCDYVSEWSEIKREWDLTMTNAEEQAIERVLQNCP